MDRLAGEWGVGHLKLDYNINIGPGTENGVESPGAGLLGHHRAHRAAPGPRRRNEPRAHLPHLRSAQLQPSVLHPTACDGTAQWNAAEGKLTVSLSRPATAVLLRLS